MQLADASNHTVSGLDGNSFRRFRIEVEGIVDIDGNDVVIGVRPNDSTSSYGPGVIHTAAHRPGDRFFNMASWIGQGTVLPVCVTHFTTDGHVVCTSLLNTQTGRFRVIDSQSSWASAGACGSTTCAAVDHSSNSWRDTVSNITSLTFDFGNGALFTGEVTIYGVK